LRGAGGHRSAPVGAGRRRCGGRATRQAPAAPVRLRRLLQATGRPDEALDHLERAVTIFAEIGGRPGELEPEIWKLVEW